MAATRQTISAMGEGESRHSLLRTALVAAVAAGMLAQASAGVAADPSTHHNLNPGVRPGDVVILRRVEPTPIGSLEPHSGPITSRVNVRDTGLDIQRQLTNGGIVALSDDQAAGIRSSAQQAPGNAMSGTSSLTRHGGQGIGASSNRAAGSLGGGSGAGGGIAGRVTSATSGIADTVGHALSPFTGRK